ncbi:MAG: hypothetical protein D6797_03945 [Bdellovibrio sp.]|nr:MAG: hypothetical protein D6797_03945 [Bdellovibrio sp.]
MVIQMGPLAHQAALATAAAFKIRMFATRITVTASRNAIMSRLKVAQKLFTVLKIIYPKGGLYHFLTTLP